MFDSEGDQQRAQSELIGIVLLFALVITVSLTVVVVGGSALGDIQSSTTTESAEISMTEFQSKLSQVGADDAAIQEVSFAETSGGQAQMSEASNVNRQGGNPGDVTVDDTSGSITIEIGHSDGSVDNHTITLGKVTYQLDGESVAYQGGGVFRKNTGSESSAMVSPPSFDYQYQSGVPTLSMPVTTVRGQASGNDFTLERASTGSSQIFPNVTSGASNPIQPGSNVSITVQSEFYRAWGSLFEQRTGVTPSYSPSTNEVTIDFDSDYTESLGGGAGAISTSEDIGTYSTAELVEYDSYDHRPSESATGNSPIYIRGDYDSNHQTDIVGSLVVEEDIDTITLGSPNAWTITGATRVGGDVFINGPPRFGDDLHVNGDLYATSEKDGDCSGGDHTVNFQGDVYVGGDVTCLNNVDIQGDLHVGDDLDATQSTVNVGGEVHVGGTHDSSWDGDITSDDPDSPMTADLPALPSLESLIDSKESTFQDPNNDNGDHTQTINNLESTASGDCADWGDYCELSAGDYYLNNGLHLEQGELVIDTSSGPVEIYTDGVTLLWGARITVDGNNPVRIYNAGEFESQSSAIAPSSYSDSDVMNNPYTLSEPDATSFWMYMPPGEDVVFGSQPKAHVGVICAPGTANPRGQMSTGEHTLIYGSLIGDIDNANNHFDVHFDEAILDSTEVCGGDWASGGMQPSTNPTGDTVGFLQVTQTGVKVSDG